jgi:hypothetical protein
MFSTFSREKLEEQLVKHLKLIKLLKKQNQYAISNVETLENQLIDQKELTASKQNEINDLEIELAKLQEAQKSNPMSLSRKLGKTLTSYISTKRLCFQFVHSLGTLTINPLESESFSDSQSPEIQALLLELSAQKHKYESTLTNESTLRGFSSQLQSKIEFVRKYDHRTEASQIRTYQYAADQIHINTDYIFAQSRN